MHSSREVETVDFSFVLRPEDGAEARLNTVGEYCLRLVERLEAVEPPGSKALFYLNLAFEELATNIAQHAVEAAKRPIRVRCAIASGRSAVEMRFMDDGDPFDLTAATRPDLDAPLEDREIGGLGLHIIRQAFTSLDYRREDGWNAVVLRLDRDES